MNIAELKERIATQLEVSDKNVLEAVYKLLVNQKLDLLELTEEEADEIETDISEYLKGSNKGFTFEQVKSYTSKEI
jgi:Mg2+ and Co2+ transporter CorA